MMKRKIILALREVAERMDDPTPLFGEDYLELWHFLQAQFVEHSQAIITRVEVKWNSILHEQDFYISVSRCKPMTTEFDLSEACMVNPEFEMDEDERIGQRMHVKSFINNIIKAL